MKQAFTLIELLVVVLIIGILAAVALPQYETAVEKARFAEAVSISGSLQRAIDVWLLENGTPSYGESIDFLGENPTGNLAIDISCNTNVGNECIGKNFSYEAGCNQGLCWILVARYINGELAYSVNWHKEPPSSLSWTGDECDYYPDVLAAGEKICKGLEAQGNGFFACEDC